MGTTAETPDLIEGTPAGGPARGRAAAAAAGVTLLAIAVRVVPAIRPGVQIDEGQCLMVVRSPTVASMLEFLRDHESHPPLFYLLLRAWAAVFGGSQTSMAILILAFGVALVPAIGRVGARVFSPAAGLLAGVLVAISPAFATFSTLIRPYSLLPLLWLGSTYGLWLGVRGGGPRAWAGHAAATLAMLYTHNWGWVALAGQWGAVALWALAGPGRPTIGRWLLAQAAVLAGYTPWFATLVHQARHAGYGPRTQALADAGWAFLRAAILPGTWPALALLALIAAANLGRTSRPSAAGDVPAPGRRPDAAGLVFFVASPLLALAATLVLSWKSDLAHAHTFLIVAPGTTLGLAVALARPIQMGRRWGWILVAAVLLFDAYRTGQGLLRPDPRSDVARVAAKIAERARPGDLILVTPAWLASPFEFHATVKNPRLVYPYEEFSGPMPYDRTRERLLDPAAFRRAKEALGRARLEGRRVWLIGQDSAMERPGWAVDPGPDEDRLPDRIGGDFQWVAAVRARQLAASLAGLYGPPELVSKRPYKHPPHAFAGPQSTVVLLFSPAGGDGPNAGGPGRSTP